MISQIEIIMLKKSNLVMLKYLKSKICVYNLPSISTV